jgi:hypothetical protein
MNWGVELKVQQYFPDPSNTKGSDSSDEERSLHGLLSEGSGSSVLCRVKHRVYGSILYTTGQE